MVFFLGESGVGKTALMSRICEISESMYMPVITVTRQKKECDDENLMEYLTVEEYLQLKANDELIVDMCDGKVSYGYRKRWLLDDRRTPLMYGSPYAIERILKFNCTTVLIEGDSGAGMRLRSDSAEDIKKREMLNSELNHLYYQQAWFRSRMNIVFVNTFRSIEESARDLLAQIQNRLITDGIVG